MISGIDIFNDEIFAPIEEINDPLLKNTGVRLFIKREDLIHKNISGNKWRKLKYNLKNLKTHNNNTLLTFGGPFSNHIAATAYTAKIAGINSIGIIRGEEHYSENPTLSFARNNGMQLHFISRELYRQKSSDDFIANLHKQFGKFFLIPEGGANLDGMKGCKEIMDEVNLLNYDLICCACGTGTTMSGIINACSPEELKVMGFIVVNDKSTILNNIEKFTFESQSNNWSINTNYLLGGYAKCPSILEEFIDGFYERTNIPLDRIYTGKMFFGIYDMIFRDEIPAESRVLAIHTGGLQGNEGFEYMKKRMS